MDTKIQIFVSYSHQDAAYLEKESLLGFLQGLESDNIEFWTDREITGGELWDEVIKNRIQRCDIALVLVSQSFLDSDYCKNVEIERFLSGTKYLYPVILSPCDWKRHVWLASRQFLPGGEETIAEHYLDEGKRQRLFLKIREQLLQRAQMIRKKQEPDNRHTMESKKPSQPGHYTGKTKILFCERLGDDWRKLADYFEITSADQARFSKGDEGREIWVWLKNRTRLEEELPAALSDIGRDDLAQLLLST